MTSARFLALSLVLSESIACADPAPKSTMPPANEIQIIAYVDGIAELHVTPDGLYWVNGMYAKPGQHDSHDFPTYVNSQPWLPKWKKPGQSYGMDRCDPFPIAIPSLNLALALIAVGETKESTDIEPRSPISLTHAGGELIITIPDPEFGPRWYHFALVPPPSEK